MQGYSDLFARSLVKGPTPEQLDRYASALSRGATRLTSLTRDLLEVARLKEPKLTYKMEPCEMSDLVRKSAEQVRELVNTTHAIEVNAEEIHVFGDCDRLEQSFINLIDNAVKYTPEGGTITINVFGEHEEVVIRFVDEGIGLPVGSAERVFAPFSRAANSEHSGINGFGLGLYICRQIIESHSGTIDAYSEGEGAGTAFTIRLPRYFLK